MKKRRFLALTLAVSLVFSSVSWAEIKMPTQVGGSETQMERNVDSGRGSTASPSDVKQKATESNAAQRASTSNALYAAEEENILELAIVGGKETVGCFDRLSLRIEGKIVHSGHYRLYSESPTGSKKSMLYISPSKNIYFNTDVSHAYNSGELGEYLFYLVDEDNNDAVVGNIIKINVVRQPTVTVEFKKQILTKSYGSADPEVFARAGYWDIQAYDSESGNSLGYVALKNLRYEREPGEEPGKYVITKLSSDEVEQIELVANDFSCFEISKITRNLSSQPVEVRQTGSEQIINIPELYDLKGEEIPTKVVLGELTEEAKTHFTEFPSVDGLNIKFTLKQSQDSYTFDIPFSLESSHYKYVQNQTEELHITVNATHQKNVETRTEEEIKSFYAAHKFDLSKRDQWAATPDAALEIPGKLSGESVENALNALNFMRYIAGIHSDVTNNEEYENYAQAGTTLLIRAGSMDHRPKQPEGVSDEFYKLGYKGTSSSNLGRGYLNLAYAVINGWMDDGDTSNIDRAGHRRWCLDPNMTQTGFGHSGDYMAMYTFDDQNGVNNYDYDFIPWPAQTMPLDYFNGPWMVSLSPERYMVKSSDQADIKVVLTSKKTGKTYALDHTNKDKSGKYFNLSAGGYGYGSALIFEPNVSFSAGDEVTVRITGLKDHYGSPETIEYTVKFFKMSDGGSSDGSNGGSSGGSGGGGGGSSSGGGGGSSSGGGGSSSGGGGGSHSGGSAVGGLSAGPGGNGASVLPDYVVRGTWTQTADLNWRFTDSNGVSYVGRWAAIENPYANTALGQSPYDWFYFDENGNMATGWLKDGENLFYLNQNSDGTRGRMVTGWYWIPDQNGVQKCYYFNPNSDGTRGKLIRNSQIDGYTLNANGEWIVNGAAQTK